MKYLIPFLLLFIIGCSDNATQPTPDQQFPYTSGAWLMTDTDNAKYIGTESFKGSANTTSAVGDTIVVTNPNGEVLELEADDYPNAFLVHFEDVNLMADSIAIGETEISFPQENFKEFFGKSQSTNGDPAHAQYRFQLHYKCGTDFEASNIYFTTYKDTMGTIYRVYDFVTDSASVAIKEVANCNTTS